MNPRGGSRTEGDAGANRGDNAGSESIGPGYIGRIRPDLAYVEVDGEGVVYDDVLRKLHRLNRAAATLWLCLDGTGSLDEIARDVAAVYSADPAKVLSDMVRAAHQLAAQGLLVGHEPSPTGDS